ncbi:MAG: prolipoprotein diacylglyceryl transferase [Calditrichia bacterium]
MLRVKSSNNERKKMIPILFEIGPLKVGSYGLMLAIAFITCLWLLRREFARRDLNPDWAYNIIFAAAIGGIIGARLYFILEYTDRFQQDPLGMIFTGSGLTWYGGFIGGIIAVLISIYRMPASNLKLADLIAPLLLLGYGIGRIGCFLAGDGDYGPPSDLPWAMSFPNGLVPTTQRVHPTPVYETLMALILFAILWKLRKKPHPAGLMVSGMLIAYGIERFLAEFWRTTPQVLGWLTMAQILSIISVLAGLIWGYYILKIRKNPPQIKPA